MHRFFIPPEWISGSEVSLSGGLIHQLRNVLRLRPGASIVVLDDSGWEYQVELRSLNENEASCTLIEKRQARSEPRVKITLYQATLKGSKFDFVLQKGTELGISRFVPVVSQRSVTVVPDRIENTKALRWRRIIQEAAEQSARGRLPTLEPATSFAAACREAQGLSLLPWEGEERLRIKDALAGREISTANIFIGPEGGFTTAEVEEAKSHGITPVTLGRRILRAETAALVAATAILYECGEI